MFLQMYRMNSTPSTPRMLLDISLMHNVAGKLLDRGKPYEKLLRLILNLVETRKESTFLPSIKELSQQSGILQEISPLRLKAVSFK